jgi:hypothetical protein
MPPRPDDPAQEPDGDPDAERAEPFADDEHHDSLIDEMRGSGVGVEDPNIVGDAEPGVVDDQVQPDQPPQV